MEREVKLKLLDKPRYYDNMYHIWNIRKADRQKEYFYDISVLEKSLHESKRLSKECEKMKKQYMIC